MTWTSTTPTQPDFWWYRKHPRNKASLVEIYVALNRGLYVRFCDARSACYAVDTCDGQWAGPLLPPE